MKKTLLLLLLPMLIACGKQGNPTAPAPVIPKGATDLLVSQRGTAISLSWSYPALTTSGRQLTTLQRVSVYRYVEELPAALAGSAPETLATGDADTRRPRAIEQFARRPLIVGQQFIRLREKIAELSREELPAYAAGARILFADTPPFRTIDNRPVRLYYAVAAETGVLEGELSNLATIVPVEPAAPPSGVTAAVQPEAVKLSWTAPSKTVSGESEPSIVGYHVYRFTADAQADAEPKPITPSPLVETSFTDTPPLGRYTYQVTAVASADPLLESAPSEPVRIDFTDRLAPDVPADLTALVESRAVRLIWNGVDSADLAGYKVYRETAGKRESLTSQPITDVFYLDESVRPGTTYQYSVTAVDRNGNESAASPTATALVPR